MLTTCLLHNISNLPKFYLHTSIYFDLHQLQFTIIFYQPTLIHINLSITNMGINKYNSDKVNVTTTTTTTTKKQSLEGLR